jgi:nucleoside-diphosphate-sugar epimerase
MSLDGAAGPGQMGAEGGLMAESELHVVFGAGQVGPRLAAQLAASGRPVRLVRRGPHGALPPGVEGVRADAADPRSARAAAAGAAVVYHCMNPSAYSLEAWRRELPPLQQGLIEAARASGARLVVLDNLYAIGRTGGRPMDERSPSNPCSRKGELRARLRQALLEAMARGEVRGAIGRASDFYGPGGLGTHFGERFWRPALAGKPVGGLVDPAVPHTYHFIPDVAAGLMALGLDPGAEGTFMLPCHPAEPTGALAQRLAGALGRPIALGRIPPLAVWFLSLGMPILREVREMGYQWEEPFLVDDARFRARFGERCVPRDEAARQTVEWARAAFGAAVR